MRKHNQTGQIGETMAAEFLVGQGFRVIARNWRWGKKEVDLIAQDQEELVFVEVKTRSNFDYGFPEEAVSSAKQNFLKAAAAAYFEQSGQNLLLRFDIVSVWMQGQVVKEIKHFRDAFY